MNTSPPLIRQKVNKSQNKKTMRNLTLLLLLMGAMGMAQIAGDKNIETRRYRAPRLTNIEIALYADITIDQSSITEEMVITTDSNLFEYIDKEVVDGRLTLDQKAWIQPSRKIKIVIGAPHLKRVQQSTNDTVMISNLDTENFSALALNGTVVLNGALKTLRIGAENGTVEARNVRVNDVYLNIWGWGKAIVNVSDYLESKLSKEARLQLISQPKKIKGNIGTALDDNLRSKDQRVKYISFKIKNNSFNRNNFYVIGPKPDGSKFSYGFPMMPGMTRKEKWTTGTKIYRVNSLGLRKLLITIQENDENKIVPLF